jgi:N-acyl-D-amino-acid deacylase
MVLGETGEVTWRSFGEYMAAVEKSQPAVNVACLVPHGAVRYATIGMDTRAPEPAELDTMREHVREGMAAGAVGMSTGLIYPPGRFAQTEEIIECAKGAAEYGGVYVSHIRDEGERLLDAVAEATRIGEEAGLPAQISHHKASGSSVYGRTKDSIAFIEARRAAGQDVTFDVYPYVAASTVLSAYISQREGADPDTVLLASVPSRPELEGKTLREAAEALDLPVDDAASAILRSDPGAVAVFFTMDEADVQRVVSHEQCMIGSDGIPTPGGKPHPRLYGTFPRVLQKYVREERLLPLEEAVRKMTSLPARRFKLGEHGELREGWFADIVVFDAERIEDVATYQEPRQYPAGIDCVIVNGRVAAEGGRQTERHAGRLVRREG